MLAVCGALLLTPGFATDVLGFAGLIPPVRYWLVSRFVKNLVVVRHQAPPASDPFCADQPPQKGEGKTLEGEFWRDQDNEK